MSKSINKSVCKRFMVYLYNEKFLASDAKTILKKIRDLTDSMEIISRDCRISPNFIEIDISLPKNQNINQVLNLLKKVSPVKEVVEVTERHLSKNEAINNAVNLFNEEKYWWSHESLEMVWKESDGEEKQLLNGLILICAAFVHNQKNEINICISILERSILKFSDVKMSVYYGINIEEIKQKIKKILINKEILQFKI
ncbi:MAG: DUF309 domain-containing protein [Nitrososphaeraceae archaeon]